jgi:hypothetical protein
VPGRRGAAALEQRAVGGDHRLGRHGRRHRAPRPVYRRVARVGSKVYIDPGRHRGPLHPGDHETPEGTTTRTGTPPTAWAPSRPMTEGDPGMSQEPPRAGGSVKTDGTPRDIAGTSSPSVRRIKQLSRRHHALLLARCQHEEEPGSNPAPQ